MTITLTDNGISLELDADWGLTRDDELLKYNSATIGGRENVFLWAQIEKWHLPIRYMSNSDAQQVNAWWEVRRVLSYNYDSVSYDIILMNQDSPMGKVVRPYHDVYTGSLIIEVV